MIKKSNFFIVFIVILSLSLFTSCQKNTSIKSTSNALNKKDSVKSSTNNNINKTNDNLLDIQYKKAYNEFFSNNYKKSVEICDEIIKKDSKFYKAYNIKGIALCFLNNFEQGMQNIDKSLSLNPNFGYARFNKALGYELHGHYDEALKWYDKALKIEDYVWSYYGKASIYGRRGDVNNTVKYLKIALSMDPNIKDTIQKERDFDPIRDDSKFKDLLK